MKSATELDGEIANLCPRLFECAISPNLTQPSLPTSVPSISPICSDLESVRDRPRVELGFDVACPARLYHPRRKPFQIRVDDDEHNNCDMRGERRKSGNCEAVSGQTQRLGGLISRWKRTPVLRALRKSVSILFPQIISLKALAVAAARPSTYLASHYK